MHDPGAAPDTVATALAVRRYRWVFGHQARHAAKSEHAHGVTGRQQHKVSNSMLCRKNILNPMIVVTQSCRSVR